MNAKPIYNCLDPRRVRNPYTGEVLIVSCGKCEACKMAKSSRYAFQCDCEAMCNKYCVFVTLTYANHYIPRMRAHSVGVNLDCSVCFQLFDVTTPRYDGDSYLNHLGSVCVQPDMYQKLIKKAHLFGDLPYLRKRDLQLFLKRLRKYLPDEKIRYFACGEYGPDKFRPHFHLLLYVNNPEIVKPSSHMLGEFPQWTWAKRKKVLPQASDRLSKLEYCIRKAWNFGCVDTELIKQGSASSYVASYINSNQHLSVFHKMAATKCFSVHSRFLGGAVFRQELVSVLSIAPDEFVKRSLEINGTIKDYRLTYQNYKYYFPRCKSYFVKTSSERLQSYRLYDRCVSFFGVLPLMDIAHELASAVHLRWLLSIPYWADYYNTTPNLALGNELQSIVDVVCPLSDVEPTIYLEGSPKPVDVFTDDYYDRLTCRIYSQLLVSRTFCQNCKLAGISDWLYLQKIENFYNCIDRLNLSEWYDAQTKYFDEDFSDENDIVYFYNDGFDINQYKESFSYRQHSSDVKKLFKDFAKHKLQNDMNGIFDND